jgi:hypothetical protein
MSPKWNASIRWRIGATYFSTMHALHPSFRSSARLRWVGVIYQYTNMRVRLNTVLRNRDRDAVEAITLIVFAVAFSVSGDFSREVSQHFIARGHAQ